MIVALDLDDTLYPERTFVLSGFRAVAVALSERHGVDEQAAYETMVRSFELNGRGTQLDDVLHRFGLWTVGRTRELLRVYRGHTPEIALPAESRRVLDTLTAAGHRLYLVTDGHKGVQARKVTALRVAPYFRHCYLTSRYGRVAAKPATRVFELMLARERATADRLVYVGDDPSKDFVGVRSLGGRTIRILTGRCAGDVARPGYGADVTIDRLADLPELV